MNAVYTIDHRYGDAAILKQFVQIMKDILEDPENFKPENYQDLPFYEDLERRKKLQ